MGPAPRHLLSTRRACRRGGSRPIPRQRAWYWGSFAGLATRPERGQKGGSSCFLVFRYIRELGARTSIDLSDPSPACRELTLETAVSRPIVRLLAQIRWQILLPDHPIIVVVGVAVTVSIAQVLHQSRWRVAQMEWHGVISCRGHVVTCLAVGAINCVAFRRESQVHRELGEGEGTFRH